MTEAVAPSAKVQEAVVLVSFAHQLVHAMCAVELDRQLNGYSMDSRVVIAVWSYGASNHDEHSTTRALFESAIQAYPFAELLFFSREERKGALSAYRHIGRRGDWLKRRLASCNLDRPDFFYAHDVSADHTAQAFMQALTDSRHLCYGDAPGFLYPPRPPHLNSLTLSVSGLKNAFWRSRAYGIHTWRAATQAYIAIDFNEYEKGGALPRPNLVPSELLLQHMERVKATLPEIRNFEDWVLALADKPTCVLLLSNFSKSRLMGVQQELTLYQQICRENLKKGERILIKKHPGTTPSFLKELELHLKDFEVESFPTSVEDLPIELFTAISTHTPVLSVSSASALFSLIPKSSVIHALKKEHIQNLFYPAQQNYMLEANNKILIHASTALP